MKFLQLKQRQDRELATKTAVLAVVAAIFLLTFLYCPGCRDSGDGTAPGEVIPGGEVVDGAAVRVLVFTQPG